MSTFSRRQFTAGLAVAAVGAKTGALGLGQVPSKASNILEVCFHGLWVFLVNETTGWITARAFMDPYAEHCFVGGRCEDYLAPKNDPTTLQMLPSSMTLKGLPKSGSGDFDPTRNYVYGNSSSWNGLQGPHAEVVLPYKPTYPVTSRRLASVQVIPQGGQPYTQQVSLSQHLSYVIDPSTSVSFVDSNGSPSSFNWSPSWQNGRDDVHFFAGPPYGVMDTMHAIAALYGVLNCRMGSTSLVLPIRQPIGSAPDSDKDLDEIADFTCPVDKVLNPSRPAKQDTNAKKPAMKKNGSSEDTVCADGFMASPPEVANCMSIVCPG